MSHHKHAHNNNYKKASKLFLMQV